MQSRRRTFRAAQEQGIELPEMFGVGFAFLPSSVVEEARAAVEVAADTERLRVIGWRRVPVNTNSLGRSEEHTSELQSLTNLVCRLLLEKKKKNTHQNYSTSGK